MAQTWIYQPKSGDRVFAERPSPAVMVIRFHDGCRVVCGDNVELQYTACLAGEHWRANGRRAMAELIDAFQEGVAYDEQGCLCAIVPRAIAAEFDRYLRAVCPLAGDQSKTLWEAGILRYEHSPIDGEMVRFSSPRRVDPSITVYRTTGVAGTGREIQRVDYAFTAFGLGPPGEIVYRDGAMYASGPQEVVRVEPGGYWHGLKAGRCADEIRGGKHVSAIVKAVQYEEGKGGVEFLGTLVQSLGVDCRTRLNCWDSNGYLYRQAPVNVEGEPAKIEKLSDFREYLLEKISEASNVDLEPAAELAA